jgi:hypothetical protein
MIVAVPRPICRVLAGEPPASLQRQASTSADARRPLATPVQRHVESGYRRAAWRATPACLRSAEECHAPGVLCYLRSPGLARSGTSSMLASSSGSPIPVRLDGTTRLKGSPAICTRPRSAVALAGFKNQSSRGSEASLWRTSLRRTWRGGRPRPRRERHTASYATRRAGRCVAEAPWVLSAEY